MPPMRDARAADAARAARGAVRPRHAPGRCAPAWSRPRLGERAAPGDGVVGATGTRRRPADRVLRRGRDVLRRLARRAPRRHDRARAADRRAARAIPVVAFVESGGARMQEGTAALAGYGRIFRETVALTGVVPQISVVSGASAGGGAYSPALTDLILMTEDAAMFLTGPGVVREALGEEVDAAALGGPRVHERNGVCHLVAPDEAHAAARVRELLSYLPSSAGEAAPRAAPREPELRRPRRARAGRAAPRLRHARAAARDRRRGLAARAVPAVGAQRRHHARADRGPPGRRSSPTSPTTSAACSTPRPRRRRPGSSASATRSGCRCSRSSTRPGSCRARARSRPA